MSHLAELQSQRSEREPPLRHRTRHFPKRAAELRAGGSIFWVINRVVTARQRVTDIIEDQWEDGARCAGLILHPTLQPVAPRPQKPFQGWRYLHPADAPPDQQTTAAGTDEIPPALRLALVRLGLL